MLVGLTAQGKTNTKIRVDKLHLPRHILQVLWFFYYPDIRQNEEAQPEQKSAYVVHIMKE